MTPQRRIIAAAAAVVALAVVGVGATFGVQYVNDADHSAPVALWKAPKGPDPAIKDKAPADTGLLAQLLPVPAGFDPGPDLGQYGNNTLLNGHQAAEREKNRYRYLPADQRRAYEDQVDRDGYRGLALRTYQAEDGSLEIDFELSQRQDKQAASKLNALGKSMRARYPSDFRGAPKVKGHPEVTCFPPEYANDRKSHAVKQVICFGGRGDLVVYMNAIEVPGSADTTAVTEMLGEQLDRLTPQGEAV